MITVEDKPGNLPVCNCSSSNIQENTEAFGSEDVPLAAFGTRSERTRENDTALGLGKQISQGQKNAALPPNS